MKKIIFLLLFFGFSSCGSAANFEEEKYVFTFDLSIDTSPEAQAAYKVEWLSNIQDNVYRGNPNIWGGGAFGSPSFAFDNEGNLHNLLAMFATNYMPLYRVVSFQSGTKAVVQFYKSAASPKLHSELYAMEIRGDAVYRTQYIINQAARGFTTVSAWDGVSYSSGKLAEFAVLVPGEKPPPLKVPDTNS